LKWSKQWTNTKTRVQLQLEFLNVLPVGGISWTNILCRLSTFSLDWTFRSFILFQHNWIHHELREFKTLHHFTRNDRSRLKGIVNSLEFEWIPRVDTWGQMTLSNSANSVDSSEWYETVTCSWKDFKVREVTKTCQNGDQDLCTDKCDILSRDQTRDQTFFSCGDGGVWVGREEGGGLWFVRCSIPDYREGWILDSIGWIPDSKGPDSGFQRQKNVGFRIPDSLTWGDWLADEIFLNQSQCVVMQNTQLNTALFYQ